MCLSAQSISTQGMDFWLSLMQNGYYENSWNYMIAQITISAKNDCEVSVSHPLYPTQTFPVGANSIYTVPLPGAETLCYHNADENETVVSKGLRITATDTISVYCANIANCSFDASFVLPLESLGDEYIVQCGEQSTLTNFNQDNQFRRINQTSAFLIVATEDNTIVEITPTVNTLGGHQANVPFSVTLNAGQTYHVRSNNTATTPAGRDLSGTHVTASDCKKIAVFAGNTLTRLPVTLYGSSGFDHIFEQVMPLRSWGKKFVVTQSMTRNRDIVKVVSASDGNVIRKNGTVVATLDAHQTHVFDLSKAEAS